MRWHSADTRYGLIPISLHWIIVAGIIVQYVLAEASEGREDVSAVAIGPMTIHGWIGFTLLGLALARLLWRFIEPPPSWPATMRPYEIALARIVHWAFYALLFAIPLSGWALATAEGQALDYFGLFKVPELTLGGGRLGEEQLEEVHEVLFNVLVGLAVFHIAAALKHQLFDRDNLLRRMLPGRS